MKKGIDFTGITIVFFCLDKQGNILLNKRSVNCRDEQGKWDCGGGALEVNENVIDTLKREIKEEYCVNVLEFEFLGYRDVHRHLNGVRTHWIALDFKVYIDKTQISNGEPHKFEEVRWFPLNKLPSPLHSQLGEEIKKYWEKLNNSQFL